MSAFAMLLLTNLLAMPLAPVAPGEPGTDEDSLLQQLGRLIGGALGGGRAEPDVPGQVLIEMKADQGPQPNEKDREEFTSRITACGHVLQAWISHTCALSDEQQKALGAVIDAEIKRESEKFSKSRDQERQHQNFSQCFPILFTVREKVAQKLSKAVIPKLETEVLTPDQFVLLQARLDERQSFLDAVFCRYAVSLIDQELFLSEGQRDALIQQLTGRVSHPLYSFNPQSYYFPYEQLGTVIPKGTGQGFLQPSQKKRLQDLNNSDPNNQHIVFQSISGPDEWQRQISETGRRQRDIFLRAAAVRMTYYQTELQLSDQQLDYLSNAAKGAAVRALGDWRETTEQTIEQMEQQMARMQGHFGFGAQLMNTDSIDSNEIWLDAVRETVQDKVEEKLKQRQEERRRTRAAALVAILDSELWLMPEQRDPLAALVEKTLPLRSDPARYQEYIREVVLLAYPLFKTEPEGRQNLLNEEQRAVWDQLSSFFQFQANNNYVQIPLKNQGGSFGFMLNSD